MGTFTVGLTKTYYLKSDPEVTETIEGYIEVEADTEREAVSKVEAELAWLTPDGEPKSGLQTVHPRIKWEGLCELNPDDNSIEYEDYSFGLLMAD